MIEHIILHALIVKETKGQLGDGGNTSFLIPQAYKWYVNKIPSKRPTDKPVIERAYLTPSQAKLIFRKIDDGPRRVILINNNLKRKVAGFVWNAFEPIKDRFRVDPRMQLSNLDYPSDFHFWRIQADLVANLKCGAPLPSQEEMSRRIKTEFDEYLCLKTSTKQGLL